MKNEIIAKLLKSNNIDDNLLALEYQYQAFKHGYTNIYKRAKYNREFRKRIISLFDNDFPKHDPTREYLVIGGIQIAAWFRDRFNQDFNCGI